MTPKWYARLLGFLLKLLPNFGPFRPLAFKPPTTETEELFLRSLGKTRDDYRASLVALREGQLHLPNRNLDTGKHPVLGEYELADKTYEKLLGRLVDREFEDVPPALAKNMAAYFGDVQCLTNATPPR